MCAAVVIIIVCSLFTRFSPLTAVEMSRRKNTENKKILHNALILNKPQRHVRSLTDPRQNCGKWSQWIDNHHPTLQDKGDREFMPPDKLNEFCPSTYGGHISKMMCRDNKGEPAFGNRTDGKIFIFCSDVNHGVTCSMVQQNINDTCPDMAVQYFCNCTTTTIAVSKAVQLSIVITSVMQTMSTQSSSILTSGLSDPRQNCGKWSQWIDNHHPTLQDKGDREFMPPEKMDEFCPFTYGGHISKMMCRDNKGEPAFGNRTDGKIFIFCSDLNHGVTCSMVQQNINDICPDMAVQYFCNCTTTTTAVSKAVQPSIVITSVMQTMSTQSSSILTSDLSAVCMYTDGTQYAQGAKWTPSCKQECKCTDAAKNIIECKEQCPVFSGLPSFCTLQPDPSNNCCMKPVCTLVSGVTLTPLSGTATPPPKSLHVLPVRTHEVITGYSKPQPGQIFVGGRDQCVYQGTLHPTGTSWDDRCDYVCTCENGATGMYRCAAKCPQYPSLPNYCKLVTVPGQCCKSLKCDIPGVGTYNPVPQLVPTPRPSGPVSGTTPNPQLIYVADPVQPVGGEFYPGGGYYLPNATSPDMSGSLRDKCVYKNRLYNQGEQWQDGCDYSCECMDNRTGYFVCNPLCPVYNNLPSQQCYLVKADGQCCSQPMCYDPNKNEVVNPHNSNSVFPVVGTYTGGFAEVRPYSSVGGNLGNRNTCIYNGTIYHKDDKWDDGCNFTCTCLDETTGSYSCSAKCPTYTNIPPICHMVPQTGSCCKRVECPQPSSGITLPKGPTQTPPTTAQPKVDPNCHDNIDNCKDYGIDTYCATYKDWAVRNCNVTCGFCPPPQCIDNLSDCKDYGLQACSGIYKPWALDNCRQYCDLCTTTAPTTAPTTPAPVTVAPHASTAVQPLIVTQSVMQQMAQSSAILLSGLSGLFETNTDPRLRTTSSIGPSVDSGSVNANNKTENNKTGQEREMTGAEDSDSNLQIGTLSVKWWIFVLVISGSLFVVNIVVAVCLYKKAIAKRARERTKVQPLNQKIDW